jgi:predicted phage baseplate assembly protein
MSASALPPSKHRSRAELLVALLGALADTSPALPLRDRTIADPTVGLLDAWASAGDVIGFYLDRIAQEGYLESASDDGSVVALAEMLGQRPALGTAATVQLAYTLNDEPLDQAALLESGLLSQSVPGPDEHPQTFETTAPLLARPSWSRLGVRCSGPLRKPRQGLKALTSIDIAGTANRLSAGDVILLSLSGAPLATPVWVSSAIPDPVSNSTTVALASDGESVPEPGAPAPSGAVGALQTLAVPEQAAASETEAPAPGPGNPDDVARLVADLKPELSGTLYEALAASAVGEPAIASAAVLRARAAPLGANAPFVPVEAGADPRSAKQWPPSEGEDATVITLDARYDQIVTGQEVVIERADAPPPKSGMHYPITAKVVLASAVVAARYGRTGYVTELQLDRPWINLEQDLQDLPLISLRAAPDALELLAVPRLDPVAGRRIELDQVMPDVEPGRPILITGSRYDLPEGTAGTSGELASIEAVEQGAGDGDRVHTTLVLKDPLAHPYVRASVVVYGNVVAAHQGATVHEQLGSGDPTVQRPTFTLSSAPLLADPAQTALGYASTLEVTVDGVRYAEVDRLGDDTQARSYVTGGDAQGRTTVTFAAALPAGEGNVRASYRVGDGGAGNVLPGQVSQLLSRPVSVRAVTNPLAGSGGTAGDDAARLRERLRAGLDATGGVVTVEDYAQLALTWSQIAKAAARTQDAGSAAIGADAVTVALTVAGSSAVAPEPMLLEAIRSEAEVVGDPACAVDVKAAVLLRIALTLDVVSDGTLQTEELDEQIRASLASRLSYERRAIGEPVVLDELVGAVQGVSEVLACTVTALLLVPGDATPQELSDKLPQLAGTAQPPAATTSVEGGAASWHGAAPQAGEAQALAFFAPDVPGMLLVQESAA